MKDVCVCCSEETIYEVGSKIADRTCYVSGAGQLCFYCYANLVSEDEEYFLNYVGASNS